MSDSDEDVKYSNYQSRSYPNPTRNQSFPQHANDSGDEDEDFDDDYGYQNDGVQRASNGYNGNFEIPPAKRVKLKNVSEFGGISDWSDHATLVLLDVWGERFLQLGRRSLRSEDWDEVAEKVSEGTGFDWTEIDCRKRMDVLKKKFNKERAGRGGPSKWVFFKKMDMLMRRDFNGSGNGLACGVDSGEFVFMDTGVYLDKANGFDEMRDSPGSSEMEDEEDGDNEGDAGVGNVDSMRMLADSVMKFGEIYKKIEDSRQTQMMELERMRASCQRELEMEKREIVGRAQAEIAQIREMDGEDSSDSSVDDHSD